MAKSKHVRMNDKVVGVEILKDEKKIQCVGKNKGNISE